MRLVLQTLNKMVESRVIENYAIAGAVAVIIYAEPVSTKDLDVLVPLLETPAGLATLTPIHDYLKKQGHIMSGQHFIIGGVPVDFMDAHDPLNRDALESAVEMTAWEERTRVVRPEHLIAMALVAGRHKDYAKIETLWETAKINKVYLTRLLKRHGLVKKLNTVMKRIYEI